MARGRSISRSAPSGRFRLPRYSATFARPDHNGTRRSRNEQHPSCEPECFNRPLRQGSNRSPAPRVEHHAASLSSSRLPRPASRDTGVSSSHSAFWDTAGCLLPCTRSPNRWGQFGVDYLDRRNDIAAPCPQALSRGRASR